MSRPRNLRVREAALRMGCSSAHARRVLLRLDRENPGLGIVIRPTGNPQGHIEVSPLALALIRHQCTADALDELSERVGLLESDHAVFRARMGGAEKRIRQLETCRIVKKST